MDSVDLAIRMTADADQAARALEDVGGSATRMASEVDDATRKADAAAGRLDSVAEGADNMASKSSQAAGGLGDLGGALALMPGPLGAVGAGMEAVAPAIMGVTGAADLANLAFQQNWIATTKAKASAVAHTAVTKVQAVATKGMAIAQRVLNAAMRANPIGLVITAVLLLVGAVVLAYKRSERFRAVVKRAMDVARAAVDAVIKVVGRLVGWVKDKAPAAWNYMKTKAVAVWNAVRNTVSNVASRLVGYVNNIRDKAVGVWNTIKDRNVAAWNAIKDKVLTVVNWVRTKIGEISTKARDVADTIRNTIVNAFQAVWDKVDSVIGAVQDLIGWIRNIDFPKMPDLTPWNGRSSARLASPSAAVPSSGSAPTVVNYIDVRGVLTESDAGRTLAKVLNRHAATMGYRPVVIR